MDFLCLTDDNNCLAYTTIFSHIGIKVNKTKHPVAVASRTLEKSISSTSFSCGTSGSLWKKTRKEKKKRRRSEPMTPPTKSPIKAIRLTSCVPLLPNNANDILPPSVPILKRQTKYKTDVKSYIMKDKS